MQVVRTRPDIEEDQRPEVHDRQFVGINRTVRLFWHEVVHHPEETRSQEETHRVVAIPPLGHRILHTREKLHRFAAPDADRHGQIVDHMQHGNGDDEGQEEPVGDVDMTLFAAQDRAKEHDQIANPNDSQPDINIPFRLGIFFGLGCTQKVSCRGQHNEQLVSPEYKPHQIATKQAHPRGSLHDVETRGQQGVATKGKNHRTCVQRAQATKVCKRCAPVEIQRRKRELKGDQDPNGKTCHAPKGRRDHAGADDIVFIVALCVDRCRRIRAAQFPKEQHSRHQQNYQTMDSKREVASLIRRISRNQHHECQRDKPKNHHAKTPSCKCARREPVKPVPLLGSYSGLRGGNFDLDQVGSIKR